MERENLEDPVVDGIKLRWIFRKLDGGMDWIALARYRDTWGGSCTRGNEPSCSIKCEEFLD